ncbi:hypothetical protein ACFX2F_025687 [Malus domestica]
MRKSRASWAAGTLVMQAFCLLVQGKKLGKSQHGLSFPAEYREWRWLLSPLHREKGWLLLRKRDKKDQGGCIGSSDRYRGTYYE